MRTGVRAVPGEVVATGGARAPEALDARWEVGEREVGYWTLGERVDSGGWGLGEGRTADVQVGDWQGEERCFQSQGLTVVVEI